MFGVHLGRWLTGVLYGTRSAAAVRIVVDGSNIRHRRSHLPSLAQLDEAIRTFLEEYRGSSPPDVTVVVDASFGHRIDPSELASFEQASGARRDDHPPAGAVDGRWLHLAYRENPAPVLSNDSFQEFHATPCSSRQDGSSGENRPRVVGIFTPRTPVEEQKSRSVTAKPDGAKPKNMAVVGSRDDDEMAVMVTGSGHL